MERLRILIVEESPLVRERLAALLGEIERAEIVGKAADGATARRLALQSSPDVAVLDVPLREGLAIDVARDIKRAAPGARVMMLSNLADPEVRELCLAGGADFFFDKSNELEQAIAVLRALGARDA